MDKKEELKKLYAQSRLSNRLLLLLIVAYVLCLFLWNNWIAVFILCIPMIGLAIWDHRLLKKMREIQRQIEMENPTGNTEVTGNPSRDILRPASDQAVSAPDAAEIKSLNDLPKAYTVLDDVIIGETPIDHIVISPAAIWVVDPKDLTETVREDLGDRIHNVPVIWVDSEQPLEDQIRTILEPRPGVMDEQEVYAILLQLSGIHS